MSRSHTIRRMKIADRRISSDTGAPDIGHNYGRGSLGAGPRAISGKCRGVVLLRDCAGVPVTCASHQALQALNDMLMAGLSFREYPLPFARRALELDPTSVLAHCMLVGGVCMPRARARVLPSAALCR